MRNDRVPLVELTRAADVPLRRLRCSTCGYGAGCGTEPDGCPMCGGSTWKKDSSALFTTARSGTRAEDSRSSREPARAPRDRDGAEPLVEVTAGLTDARRGTA